MVCIVPHFIIFLYNNHTYIRILTRLLHASNWNLADFKFFNKFINLRARLNTGTVLSKRYVKGTYDCMRRCKPVEEGCTRSNNTPVSSGVRFLSEVVPRLSLFIGKLPVLET
jgi:hypothetical protein